ncbi:hypothetical protein PF005_g19437 [Phytophthora fragariae]|uniref:Uncharacterized protein n=1 Tax=Phytophthora fragariae TaxID=53985 RepID=A0A6A3FRE2_9STRA|nr:hypothetical protein PF003_g16501 [Phytophthora fragariae]KAE8946590.1 hypothetical protein PF009_g3780 [Phytophthora fragariae]KAE9131462.1 hypothetical protein PF007_g4130 [Phytophthora fragariae]KAE9132181.1 hypothetical protein PF010_g3267 [Phytophthora fragariae]KAE9152686.1 hypothetical protein PF006_g3137 [Phytophthora fragariae]
MFFAIQTLSVGHISCVSATTYLATSPWTNLSLATLSVPNTQQKVHLYNLLNASM